MCAMRALVSLRGNYARASHPHEYAVKRGSLYGLAACGFAAVLAFQRSGC